MGLTERQEDKNELYGLEEKVWLGNHHAEPLTVLRRRAWFE